jgi:ADP-ribosylglycohydrolase
MMVTLKDKFIGCIAGVHIGSAMGAVTEHMHWKEIEEKYGYLNQPVAYSRGGTRPAGRSSTSRQAPRRMA